jgi:hypothetical protein
MTWGRWLQLRKSLDLFAVIAITAAAVALTVLEASNAVARLTLALPLALVLPGYALSASAFPRRALGAAERTVLTFGLSLAVLALGGLVLNWAPSGLQARPWALLLAAVTLGTSAGALRRRMRQRRAATGPRGTRLSVRQALTMALAALVAAAAVGVARAGAAQQATPGFTQLWILPVDDANDDAVRLGIGSMEAMRMAYGLRAEAGSYVVHEWSPIELEPGQRWETLARLPRRRPGVVEPMEAVLYRLDAPHVVYRRVVLWRGSQSEE